ncbi:hypothetical protein ACWGI1_09405 [Streptomyces sp. NPDC054835]|uniref:hypothetical protein n=1 Tax=Streptomyces sp. NBC_01268 TaxID=2903806 RepID=UPI002E36BBE9|nr:hypothetical protein [Streptomyces sp. NBC_01268]
MEGKGEAAVGTDIPATMRVSHQGRGTRSLKAGLLSEHIDGTGKVTAALANQGTGPGKI